MNAVDKNNNRTNYAPGMRIVVRDAEWIVRKADLSADGGFLIECEGLSELVRGKEGRFLTAIENDPDIGQSPIKILDPATTKLVEDRSSNYRGTLLYIESLLRQRVPTDENIHFGHKAAMDPLPFQLDPTLTALKRPRQRILIADAVGLGKTLEAGILMSELMRRGKGKRILVLAVKSMLTQFQKEMWNRFSIPLTRLDSAGLQRVRNRIPSNHNPFLFFDKSIISIDTLKQDIEYRHYLEKAAWDIIVIDEAHNVAERGTNSQRSRVAKLLANRSDALIMLSATPHDGKPQSFASLMNMLDATAINDSKTYQHQDFKDKGLIVRRFKKDVKDQIAKEFPARQIATISAQATAIEEDAYGVLINSDFATDQNNKNKARLFRVTLEKALFSSPMACLSTVNNRLKRLNKQPQLHAKEIETLSGLAQILAAIDATNFAKYQQLLLQIQDKKQGFGWKPNKKDDRIVIFTESVVTLNFLQHHLVADLKLKEGQLAVLHGQMSDIEIMNIVEGFGKTESKIRLLICSDVASEGINLHYLSHKMIHFDIPWSLMVFQQRNGRIDRYGQSQQPQIRYLLTQSDNAKISGDSRILEVLIEKDQQAQLNIGDPSEFTGVYEQDSEEQQVADVMAQDTVDGADFLADFFDDNINANNDANSHDNPLAMFANAPQVSQDESEVKELVSLYDSNVHYASEVLALMKRNDQAIEYQVNNDKMITLTAPLELTQRFKMLPSEVYPANGQFFLTESVAAMNQEIERARGDQHEWPKLHFLWQLHPVMQWLNDKVLSHFGRHQAPILRMPDHLPVTKEVFLLSAVFPNRRGQPMINEWAALSYEQGEFASLQPFDDFLQQYDLAKIGLSNPGTSNGEERLQNMLPKVIEKAAIHFDNVRNDADRTINIKLQRQVDALERLRGERIEQLELDLSDGKGIGAIVKGKKAKEQQRIDKLFDDYIQWIEDAMTSEKQPYIQVIAVLTGAQG